MSAGVVRFRGELCQQDTCDDESDHVAQVPTDKSPATTEAIDEHHAKELSDQGDDGVDGLITERVIACDTDLLVDLHGIISVIRFIVSFYIPFLQLLPMHGFLLDG